MNRDISPTEANRHRALRRRVVAELATIGCGAALFLWLAPQSLPLYLGLAALALLLVLVSARHTHEHVWDEPTDAHPVRSRRAMLHMAGFTALAAGSFLVLGLALHGTQILNPRVLLLTLAFYLPWALAQQTLFQFYLLGRLRVLAPGVPPLLLCAVSGLLYGATHLPSGWIQTGLTVVGGTFWSYSYHRDRKLVPVAVSHAVLGSTLFCWLMNQSILS